jgi:hypothetical protein
MLTIWILIHTVKLNTVVPDYGRLNETVNHLMDRVIGAEELLEGFKDRKKLLDYSQIYQEQIDYLNTTEFGIKFNEMRDLYGPGHVFIWQDRQFTTYYAEEEMLININKKKVEVSLWQ